MDYKQDNSENSLFFYSIMFHICNIHSPIESIEDVNFPNKDKLGGNVLKFKGGGAAYFKIQNEMPTKKEFNLIFEVVDFLNELYGSYIIVRILCMPHVEIKDIEVIDNEKCSIEFFSARKNDGDHILEMLSKKLGNNEEFMVDDYILKILLPYMSRADNEEFSRKYSKFLHDYNEKDFKTPVVSDLEKSSILFGRLY